MVISVSCYIIRSKAVCDQDSGWLQVDSWVSVPKIPEAVTHQSEGKKATLIAIQKKKKEKNP